MLYIFFKYFKVQFVGCNCILNFIDANDIRCVPSINVTPILVTYVKFSLFFFLVVGGSQGVP